MTGDCHRLAPVFGTMSLSALTALYERIEVVPV